MLKCSYVQETLGPCTQMAEDFRTIPLKHGTISVVLCLEHCRTFDDERVKAGVGLA